MVMSRLNLITFWVMVLATVGNCVGGYLHFRWRCRYMRLLEDITTRLRDDLGVTWDEEEGS